MLFLINYMLRVFILSKSCCVRGKWPFYYNEAMNEGNIASVFGYLKKKSYIHILKKVSPLQVGQYIGLLIN